jgi:hypothetical protein
MKTWILIMSVLALAACSSKKKLETVETELEGQAKINNTTSIGKAGSGDTVIQEKTKLVDYLVDLERQVYAAEETIFGNKAYGNIGKYGALENCAVELQKQTSGKWGMVEMPEKIVLTKLGGPKKKPGIDEKKRLVVLSQEEITARIKRFEDYKEAYENQDDWYDTEIKNCNLKLKNREEGAASKPFPKYTEGAATGAKE